MQGTLRQNATGPLEARPVVRVNKLNHYFGAGESRSQVLFDNSIEIPAGQLVVMTGPSGSGKTTLLTLIGALRTVQEGTVEVFGHKLLGLVQHELVAVRRNIGFIFQMHNLFDALSAYENVQLAMRIGSCPPGEMRARGTEILKRLGLGHRIDYKPRSLSGGQRQRVAVARALVNRPQLILADEPTAALDRESSQIVVSTLKEMALTEGCTILMVTHDNRILDLADRIVNMVDGSIVSDVVISDALTICEFLRTIGIFADFTPTVLANVAEKMTRRHYVASETIIREHDVGTEFFVIASGNVDVFQRTTGDDHRIAQLGPGDFFGERALISGGPRTASVVATEPVEAYVLGKADFDAALATSAQFKEQLVRVFFQRQ